MTRCRVADMFSSDSTPGSKWLADGVRLLMSDREPCLVCGHPTGDCIGDPVTAEVPPQVKFAPLQSEPKRAPEPEVLVQDDIWEEVQVTPLTKTRVLVAKAGTYIAKDKAEKLGLI